MGLHASPEVAIENAKRENSKKLELNGWRLGANLTEIPEAVFELSALEELDLSNNEIREVPERIRCLTNLKRLFLYRTPIEKVPDIPGLCLNWDSYLSCNKTVSAENVEGLWIDVAQFYANVEGSLINVLRRLPRLRELHIVAEYSLKSETKPPPALLELIEKLDQLTSLRYLRLFNLLFGSVPEKIRRMKSLHTLSVFGAGISALPDWLGDLTVLRELDLKSNQITNLPKSMVNLSKLEVLDLADNPFSQFPEIVFDLPSLTQLFLDYHSWPENTGQIKQVPAGILRLLNLETLDVSGHPIEIPPPEIVKKGVAAIKKYWRQQQEVGVDYLCEAKLIVLGEPGAGKTTLTQKIQNRNYILTPEEKSTEGIDVVRWTFPSMVRVKCENREEVHKTDFRASIWDFGGQEIYHATHQFFLTRRSLYVLVTDDRKEDTDFNYWLHAVELSSDGSPLIIVQNEKQDRRRDIDLSSLRTRFANFKDSFRINLATNKGLEELKAALRNQLEQLPHIGTPLPRTWSRVRSALEKDSRNFITLDEYFTVCQQNGFERREDKLQLSGYLHDLGIFLHFQEDPILKNTVILKPKWGTDAVYQALDDPEVIENRGRFNSKDLGRIWADADYSTMRDELLQLMVKFQLCYELSGSSTYIAPQLLSPTPPVYRWPSQGLVMRYEYDFMPKGILTRFIVSINHLIKNQDLVWKSGVILARGDATAEVIEDYSRRRIVVRVNGPESQGLLAIIDDCLEQIHSAFPHLAYDKFLPCNCESCVGRDEPFSYPLRELKDFASQGDGIQCRISRKLVDARSLIREVLPATVNTLGISALQSGSLNQEVAMRSEVTPEAGIAKEVFVSYTWNDESPAIVDALQEALAGQGIVLVRDKRDMSYKDSISDFMKRMGRGKSIVVVLSQKYLESVSCMFEMTEIASRADIRNRVFPIILKDARIDEAICRVRYIQHWEKKKAELDEAMKSVGSENLQGIREELDLYVNIRNTISQIVETLRDMNALTPEQHKGSNFDSLLRALQARVSE